MERVPPPSALRRLARRVRAWFDSGASPAASARSEAPRADWSRAAPFVAMHLGCLGVLFVGADAASVTAAILLYAVRMFAITGFYHRYFSHRAFRTSRPWQFVFALVGASAAQRGPLWWAAHHRVHHRTADTESDVHSPVRHGFLWSHIGWITSRSNFPTRVEMVPDLSRYPELRFLDRFDTLVPLLLAALLAALGGARMFVWGFCISTVALYHATFTINSLAHQVGSRRYATPDQSRNNVLLALLTFGEGWHNNHHHYPGSARQGFFWWEVDLTYYLLRLLALVGIVRDLRPVPAGARNALG